MEMNWRRETLSQLSFPSLSHSLFPSTFTFLSLILPPPLSYFTITKSSPSLLLYCLIIVLFIDKHLKYNTFVQVLYTTQGAHIFRKQLSLFQV